jgi:nitrogen fixation protein FixH
MAAKKKKSAAAGKGAKATSARRAVNIKVNVVSKNPKAKKRKPAKRRPVKRAAKRITSKRKAATRFVICARTRSGKSFYETKARKFIADRKQARLFPSQAAASKEAHRMLAKMPATVKTLAVERA